MTAFYETVNEWLSRKGCDIDALVDLASSRKERFLEGDLRNIRGRRSPQRTLPTAEFLAEQMQLSPDEKQNFLVALGLVQPPELLRAGVTAKQRLFMPNADLTAGQLDKLWDEAMHSGWRLAVAMRRKGWVPNEEGTETVMQQLDLRGLYDSENRRDRYRFQAMIGQWLGTGKVPIGLQTPGSDASRLVDALTDILSPELDERLRQQLLQQTVSYMPPGKYVPRWRGFNSYGRNILPPVEPKTAGSVPSPKRIGGDALADRIEAYTAELGGKLTLPQQKTLADIVADLRKGNIGGIVKRPTGTGKTMIFCVIAAALLPLTKELEEETAEQNSVGILVPNNVLEQQTFQTLLAKRDKQGKPFFHAPGNPDRFAIQPDDIAVYSDQNTDRQRMESLNKPITIMTFSALESKLNQGVFNLNRLLYTIIDEVDMAKDADQEQDMRTEKIRRITKTMYSAGFSATTKYVSPQLGPRDVSETLYDRSDYIHATRIRKAAETGEVCPITNVVMVTDFETQSEQKGQFEYRDEQVNQLINIPGRDRAIIERVFKHVDAPTGIAFKDLDQIWFCRGIDHAKRVASYLNALMGSEQAQLDRNTIRERIAAGDIPVYAMSVDGLMPDEDWTDSNGVARMGRMEILALHREGKIPVICNADLLIRGFDSQRTQLSVMTYPSMSDAKVEQIGGRIGRLDPQNPDKMGFIVNVLDQDTHQGRVFADDTIAESSHIGQQPGHTYQARRLRDGETPRQPNFAILESQQPGRDTIAEDKVFSEPEAVAGFLASYRTKKPNPTITGDLVLTHSAPALQV